MYVFKSIKRHLSTEIKKHHYKLTINMIKGKNWNILIVYFYLKLILTTVGRWCLVGWTRTESHPAGTRRTACQEPSLCRRRSWRRRRTRTRSRSLRRLTSTRWWRMRPSRRGERSASDSTRTEVRLFLNIVALIIDYFKCLSSYSTFT